MSIIQVLAGIGQPVDPYFEYTTLLLPGNGTNGAQNNTFLDASTNNFTITRNGNTTQGTFSPFSQTGWGNYFDGTGDSLTIPSGSSISGTGNFTVEFWIYPTTFASGYQVPYINETASGFAVLLNSTGTLSYGRALVAVDGTTTGTVTFNQWNHVAFVRSGTGSNQFICYINGSSAGSFTNSTNYSSGIVRIGTDAGGTSFPFLGYLSNVRNVTVAVYTGAFTPPTSPLAATQSAGTNISAITGTQTSLLTCQSNRFIDNSTNNFTITRNGDTRVVAFSPFAPSAAWSSTTNGGSGYFDGNGDYLSVADNDAFALGSNDWTIECWVYVSSLSAQGFIAQVASNGADSTLGFILGINASGYPYVASYINGAYTAATASTAIVTNQWNHIAGSRASGTMGVFLNGSRLASTAVSGSSVNSTATVTVGASQSGSSALTTGYIANARIVNGTAVYSGTTYTVPTAPLTAITNTSLLLNFTNAGIYDATSKNDLETVGNAQISTTQSKWGGSSMYFDGTGDWLLTRVTDLYNFGTGDFTVECWAYTAGNVAYAMIFDSTAGGGTGGAGWFLEWSNTRGLVFFPTGYTRAYSITLNQWYHIAVTRSGTNLRMFVNGTQQGATETNSSNIISSQSLASIAATNDAPHSSAFNGYLQDLRITKGYARYTANFTPPTAAFPTL